DGDPVVLDDEIGRAGNLLPPPAAEAEQPVEGRHRLAVVLLERGAEDAGEIADLLRHQEVVLHEALDVLQPRMGRIAQPGRHLALDVEGKALLGPAGEEVHVAAYGPEEILRLPEALELGP